MTGWERHSLRSIPGVKVGKVRVQVLGTGGHTFMLTEVRASEEQRRQSERARTHWGFELEEEGNLFGRVCVCLALPLYSDSFEAR